MADTSHDATRERIKFEDPPVNELVVSLFHLPILELRAQDIGVYWSRIRERYPLCDQQNVVASQLDPQPFIQAPGEVFPLPRFWFYSNSHSTLIQVQRNAFMFNWRRLQGAPAGDYPHYETVVGGFWQELDSYRTFIQETTGGKLERHPAMRTQLYQSHCPQ